MGSDPRGGRARSTVVAFPQDRHALPSVMRLLPSGRSLAIGFLVVALAAGSYTVARLTSMFAIQTIDVRGGTPLVRAHVRAALARLEGTSLVALGSGAVSQRLEALPDVGSATYDRAFPHTLRVYIRAETAIAVVRRGADAWLVSADARVIRELQPGTAPALPRIWVPASADVHADGTLDDRAGAAAVRALAALQGVAFPIHVRVVKVDDGQVAFLLRSGLELHLGAPIALPLKLAVARRILPVVRRTIAKPQYIDVSVPARPVAQ
jgi:cell division protein FtsQ